MLGHMRFLIAASTGNGKAFVPQEDLSEAFKRYGFPRVHISSDGMDVETSDGHRVRVPPSTPRSGRTTSSVTSSFLLRHGERC